MIYSSLRYKAKKYLKRDYLNVSKEECVKAYNICGYLDENFPILAEALDDKVKFKNNQDIFSVMMFYFSRLAEPMVVERLKKIINLEVTLTNQILKYEPEWYYLDNHSFCNPGICGIENFEHELGLYNSFYSKILFNDGYEIEIGDYVDLNESKRFFKEHRELLYELSHVILEKKELLNKIYLDENLDNYMDLEILKIIVGEMGADGNCGSLNFLIWRRYRRLQCRFFQS